VITRRLTALATLAVVACTTIAIGPSSSAQAAVYTMRVVSPIEGRIGIDGIYSPDDGNGYDMLTCSFTQPELGWDKAGNLTRPAEIPSRKAGPLVNVRFEMYPGACAHYDAWADVGGVHFETGPGGRDLGTITMPVPGRGGAFRIDGDILSSTPVGTDRVLVEAFQIETGMQDNGAVAYGAFGTGYNKGNRWTAGVGWSGRYMTYVTDKATGNKVSALVDINPNTIPAIDLDAICFGFDTCNYLSGGPGTTAGTFHPTAPTRILDTRTMTGITNGPVRTGDGRHPSPDPITRRDETANHDLQVTGLNGIPTSGVSAVLLNVTAVGAGAPGPGFMSVVPKPARVGDVFNDQGSYGAYPSTSNLNLENADPTPNLVLARVGAGGKIRIFNYVGPTHVIADVAGWFGTGGAHTNGSGFSGVVPSRVFDSRLGIGTNASQFRAGETRSVRVAGVSGIPADAQSVVVNVTMVGSSGPGYATAYPTGGGLPNASNVNVTAGGVRANTSVVKVGAGGQISLYVAETNADIVVDVLGSFGPNGGRVTTITPERVVDSRGGLGTEARPFGEFESRSVQIAGRGSVPTNATAVIANLTATNTTAWGYLGAWPTGAAQPSASNLNFLAGQTVPNLVMLKLGAGGAISIANGPGSANVLVDVMGYVV
jgi:hypothetical protein